MVASVGRCYTNPLDYAQENYYTQGESFTNSEWLGKAASVQGLSGQIKEQDFLNAYSSLDPEGNPLRKQQQYKKSSHRYNRPGTDVTLSAPKSVSVAALVYQDQKILEAHKAAVRSTMKYVENNCIFYQTKQRGKKQLLQSKTAQIAVFHHDDNRNKDPQLHSHCVILNQTQCPDSKWRAVANEQLYKQQKTIGAYYDHELARQIQKLGYQVEWTSDHTFELAGIDKEKLDAVFSTRSNQIEAELAKLGLTRSTATAEQKQAVCLKTRQEKKQHHHPQDRIKQLEEWQTRARESGIEISKPTEYHRDFTKRTYNNPDHSNSLKNLISNATENLTEHDSAFKPHELLRECLRQSQGRYDPEKILSEINSLCEVKAFEAGEQRCRGAGEKDSVELTEKPRDQKKRPTLIATRDGRLTTKSALTREQKIIQLAKGGRDSQIPLSTVKRAEAVSQTRFLNQGQATALKQMVTSRDSVILIQGNAGVGKTYTMKAFAETVGDKQTIRGLAPSAAAASVLQNESGITSQTLASYLLTPKKQLPQQEVILVDEAGMISTRSAQQLLEKAHSLKSRVILIGDTKQLSAVSAGAPFKLLQDAGLPTAIIDQNLRQRDPSLKQVVNSLATHDKEPDSVNGAYQKLNESGKIKQILENEKRIDTIASDYLSRPVEIRRKTLILAGTNGDKKAIASKVRQGLIAEGTKHP
ncbi:MAG: MobF family relaxase [Xenococcaceae cyanobacterium MO_188.B32]|nr:MobF family relaxase [Xenococcaceae cyanobacterium MO_188.B32]